MLQLAMENAMIEQSKCPLPKSLTQDFKMLENTKVRTEFLETWSGFDSKDDVNGV